jgi:integrase
MIISGSRSPNSRSVCKRDHKRIRSCNAAPDRSTQHDRLDRNELGELLVAAGLGTAAEHVLMSLLAINGLRISEALGADVDDLGLERAPDPDRAGQGRQAGHHPARSAHRPRDRSRDR